jgi:hypothetical protein
VTLNSVVWANGLSDISPVAKLVAIDLAGASGAEEIGRRNVTDLADFACCTPSDVQAALTELGGLLTIEIEGETVRAFFPTREDDAEAKARRVREEVYKQNRPYQLYVISKGDKIKIGISRKLEQRLEALRVSFPIAIEVLFTIKGPFRSIRRAELDAHDALKDVALGGEYFAASRERALDAVRSALGRQGIAAP